MFRNKMFYDNLTDSIVDTWTFYLMIGLSLVISGLLILIFPELLAYLVAIFLLFNGVLFLAVSYKMRNLKTKYEVWVDEYWES